MQIKYNKPTIATSKVVQCFAHTANKNKAPENARLAGALFCICIFCFGFPFRGRKGSVVISLLQQFLQSS